MLDLAGLWVESVTGSTISWLTELRETLYIRLMEPERGWNWQLQLRTAGFDILSDTRPPVQHRFVVRCCTSCLFRLPFYKCFAMFYMDRTSQAKARVMQSSTSWS